MSYARYAEAIDVLYSTNRFHFYSSGDLLEFRRSASTRNAEAITSVQLVLDPYVFHWKLPAEINSTLLSLKGLSQLTILVGRSMRPIRFGHRVHVRFATDYVNLLRLIRGNARVSIKLLVCNCMQQDPRLHSDPGRSAGHDNITLSVIPDQSYRCCILAPIMRTQFPSSRSAGRAYWYRPVAPRFP